jgi:surface polysaccharide O-acyltransferase-like enzyme
MLMEGKKQNIGGTFIYIFKYVIGNLLLMYHRRKYFRTKLTNIILMSGGISNKMRPAFSFDKTISYNQKTIYLSCAIHRVRDIFAWNF